MLVAVASLVRPRVPRDGMVLGATVGAGFAAFESAGYALGRADPVHRRPPGVNVLQTEAFRAVLAPFGHITWTAILGGAIFASAWATGPSGSTAACCGRSSASSPCTRCWDAVVRVGDPDQQRARRRRLALRLARHLRLGRHADRCGPAPLSGRLRRHARRSSA